MPNKLSGGLEMRLWSSTSLDERSSLGLTFAGAKYTMMSARLVDRSKFEDSTSTHQE